MENHEKYMKKCLDLAKMALANEDSPVGAIIVANNSIIGKGIESVKSMGDITNHAEIQAIRNTIANGNEVKLEYATLYTTHEPCLMCSYVIRHYEIEKVVFGSSVDFIGGDTSEFKILRTEKNPKWGKKPSIISGVCENESNILSKEYQQLNNK